MNFSEQDFIPVILGADIAAYSLARSFHEEYGVTSVTLGITKNGYVPSSTFIDNRCYPGFDKNEGTLDHIIEVGKEFEGKKLILLGCGDWYVRTIIDNKELLEKYFIIPSIDADLQDRLVLKDSFYGICEEVGVDCPRTYVYECGSGDDLKFDFDYPVIAKPANSSAYHYISFPGMKKVFEFDREEDLRAMLDELEKTDYDGRFVIQEKIPGDDTSMYVLTCYCDRDSNVRLASLGHTLIEDPTPGAIGNPVAIVNEVDPGIVAAAEKLLRHVGYVGFANFDVRYDERDGSYRFLEVNVRPGRSNYYVTGSGFNLVKWVVDEYIYDALPEYRDGDTVIADREYLYSVVPRSVIEEYVPDGELKAKAMDLWSRGKVARPLMYKGEKSIRERFYGYYNYYHHVRKFRNYK